AQADMGVHCTAQPQAEGRLAQSFVVGVVPELVLLLAPSQPAFDPETVAIMRRRYVDETLALGEGGVRTENDRGDSEQGDSDLPEHRILQRRSKEQRANSKGQPLIGTEASGVPYHI